MLCGPKNATMAVEMRGMGLALLDRGYGKPTQPISQTLAKVDPSSISDEELAAIAMNRTSVNAQAH